MGGGHAKTHIRETDQFNLAFQGGEASFGNTFVVERSRVDSAPLLTAAVADAEGQLGARGRVLLRPSGTEPVVRVMVEAPTEAVARDIADRLADVVRTELALD